MAEEYRTPAAKALRKHYDELVSVIQEPDLPTLGAGFFSLEVISRQTMEMVGNVTTPRTVRISKLLLAMMSHLDLHPEKFDSVMDVLNQERVYARVSRDISETLGEIKSGSSLLTIQIRGLKYLPVSCSKGYNCVYRFSLFNVLCISVWFEEYRTIYTSYKYNIALATGC